MRHIRIDNERENSKRRFACGIGPALPAGDDYVFDGEVGLHHTVDCPGCMRDGQCTCQTEQYSFGGLVHAWRDEKCPIHGRTIGTPIAQLSGRPGHKGYERFCEIAKSWGYD